MLAACTTAISTIPIVSTRMWRLRPATFLPASDPRSSPPRAVVLTLCESKIAAVGCDGCELVGNRTAGNRGGGIVLSASTGARVDGNTATGNRGSGIEVGPGATGNRLAGNRAIGNAGLDLTGENLSADPCPNAWRDNRFATDNEGDGPGAGCIR